MLGVALQALEVYMYCNTEEMNDYFTNAQPMDDINKDLEMDIDEFVKAILLIAACKLKIPKGGVSKKKTEDVTKKFEEMLEEMLSTGLQQFADVKLPAAPKA